MYLYIIATQRDHCRKPEIGMWEYLQSLSTVGPFDMKQSFYVGDAAGRAGILCLFR